MEVDLNTSQINFIKKIIVLNKLIILLEGSKLIFFIAANAAYPCLLEHAYTNMDLNEQLISSLKKCVTSENLYHIHELLMKGADPNTTDCYGNAPIHLAIMKSPNNVELILELIRFGCDLNLVNKCGSTALAVSLYKKCHRTSAILIKKGINCNFQCQRGWTALMTASMMGDLCCVRTLLQHGANINAYDACKCTALMFAVEGSYFKVVKELLDYGANPGMCDAAKRTALHYALERVCPDLNIINELLLHCASYEVLEENSKAYKQMMNICLFVKPPIHKCIKTMIKIQMLLTQGYDCISNCKHLKDFAFDCCTEIRYMKHYNVSRCNNVETLLMKCLRGNMPTEREIEALLPLVANKCFIIYSDILRALIKKSYLRKKFIKMLMYVKRDGQAEEITINSDVNLRILSYLSDNDVLHFVLAGHIKTNSQEKDDSENNSLYPTGMICDINDLTIS